MPPWVPIVLTTYFRSMCITSMWMNNIPGRSIYLTTIYVWCSELVHQVNDHDIWVTQYMAMPPWFIDRWPPAQCRKMTQILRISIQKFWKKIKCFCGLSSLLNYPISNSILFSKKLYYDQMLLMFALPDLKSAKYLNKSIQCH